MGQFLSSSGVGWRSRDFLHSPGGLIGQYFFNFEAATRKMNSTFAAIVEILLINFNFELSLDLRMVGAGPVSHGHSSFRDGSTVGNR